MSIDLRRAHGLSKVSMGLHSSLLPICHTHHNGDPLMSILRSKGTHDHI